MPSTERERAEQSGTETVWDKSKQDYTQYDFPTLFACHFHVLMNLQQKARL